MRFNSLFAVAALLSGALGAIQPHLPHTRRTSSRVPHDVVTSLPQVARGMQAPPAKEEYGSSTSLIPTDTPLPVPPLEEKCDPHCACAHGTNVTLPSEPRFLCGWCPAVSPTQPDRFPLDVWDIVLCKPDGSCCNYGLYNGRCEASLDGTPVNWDTYCPWPVQQLDPPDSSSSSRTSSKRTGWPIPIVTVSRSTSLTDDGRRTNFPSLVLPSRPFPTNPPTLTTATVPSSTPTEAHAANH